MSKLFLIIVVAINAQLAFAETQRVCFNVDGMTCAACTVTTKAAIKKLDGIESIKISLDEKKAEVQFNDTKTNSNAIMKKIDSIGYKATKLPCDRG